MASFEPCYNAKVESYIARNISILTIVIKLKKKSLDICNVDTNLQVCVHMGNECH